MEKRLLFFFAVTFVIMWAWFRLFPPPEMVGEGPGGGTSPSIASEAEAGPADPDSDDARVRAATEESTKDPEGAPVVPRAPSSEVVASEEEETIRVETERFELEFTNRGARLVSARLLEFKDAAGDPYELIAVEASEAAGVFPLDVRFESPERTRKVREALFRVEGSRRQKVGAGRHAEVVFSWADGQGLAVTKRVRVEGDSYLLGVEVSAQNGENELAKELLYGAGLGVEGVRSSYAGVEKGVVDARGQVSLFAAGDIEEGAGDGVGIGGVGVASHYFVALMLPGEEAIYGARLETTKVPVAGGEEGSSSERQVISAALVSSSTPARFDLFLGPKKLELLESLGPGLTTIIEFGDWMRYPALLLRSALLRIYDVVGNYGWAIVLLTVLINIVLVPLKHYSFVSMRKMQKLGPQIQRIRDRYRKVKPTDPRYQQMNQEVMELYKQHNVNPVSGCLPMLLMIPFFFAFYRLLMASIELRQAPFVGWIHDLSVHDPFFVLPILMGLSQVATQKMTPQTTADPVQAKVMSFMPILFTFILAWAPAGLVLYWFSNNVVSMGQQVVTNRFLAGREEEQEAAAKKKRKGKKSTKKE